MRNWLFILTICLLPIGLSAETKEHIPETRHEIRIGIGDAILGQLGITGSLQSPISGSPANPYNEYGTSMETLHQNLLQERFYRERNVVLPHFFAGYQYRFKYWFSFGFQLDLSGGQTPVIIMNGYGINIHHDLVKTMDWALIPEAKFTYFHREKVNLFSTIGLGCAMRTQWVPVPESASYTNYSREYEWSPALQGTLLGVSIGSGHWFGTFELGYHFAPPFGVLMHKMLSASIGYRL